MSDQRPDTTPPDAEPLPTPVTDDEPLFPDAEPLPARGPEAEPLDESTQEESTADASDPAEDSDSEDASDPAATGSGEVSDASADPAADSSAEAADASGDSPDAASGDGPGESPADASGESPSDTSLGSEADVAEPLSSPTEPPDEDIEEGPAPLGDDELDAALEALLLVVDSPVEEEALATALDTTPLRVAEHLRLLSNKYTDQDRGIDLRRAGGGWRFYTRDRYAPYVEKFLLDGQRAKLTRAALETLAVIAYRQPVTRARVAAVRGVNCDGVIRTLLARGLVEETGTDQETGGHLYRTTELFLERLGLSSLEDLPPIAPLLPEVDSIDEL